MVRLPIPVLIALLAGTGCGDCVRKARSLSCPEGYVGYGRRLPNQNKDWLPRFALTDLAAWAAGDSYADGGRCELACVPAALGEPDRIGTCDAFQPCGGEVLGDWRWEAWPCHYEVDPDLSTSCAEAVQVHGERPDGTLSFDADGTVRFTGTTVSTFDVIHLPPACVQTLNSCQGLVGVGDACAGELEAGCTCSAEGSTNALQWEGRWSKEGSTLTIERDGVASEVRYCASKDHLILDWEPAEGAEVGVREILIPFARGD